MTYKYFIGCRNLEEVKKVFRDKSKLLHPDINPGKTDNEFKILNGEYQYIKKSLAFPIANRQTHYNVKPEPTGFRGYSFDEMFDMFEKPRGSRIDKRNVPNADYIDFTLLTIKGKGYKTASLYYCYVDYIKQTKRPFHKNDLEYIADLLGYSDGWVYHKTVELGL